MADPPPQKATGPALGLHGGSDLLDVLVIDGDAALAIDVATALGLPPSQVRHVASAAEARAALSAERPDAIVLSAVLPDTDALVFCARLRQNPSTAGVPIVVIGEDGQETERRNDVSRALLLGADDYLTKPLDREQFASRISAVIRRRGGMTRTQVRPPARTPPAALRQAREMRPGSLEVDERRSVITLGGVPLAADRTAHRMLADLLAHPHDARSRLDMARAAWGEGRMKYDYRAISRSVHQLRVALDLAREVTGAVLPHIVTVRGFGYRLVWPPSGERSSAA